MTPEEIVKVLREVAADAKGAEGDYYADQYSWHGAGEIADAVEQMAAEIARFREERRWVSVGEKLPEDNVDVLAWGPCNGGAEMVWREHGKWHLSFVGTYIPDSIYTHWRPLPPGPEGDE